jgi:hypothetical protein
MKRAFGPLLSAAAGLLLAGLHSPRFHVDYGPRVYTRRNIGRDQLKPVRNSRYQPHQGEREMARRRRQLAEGKIR